MSCMVRLGQFPGRKGNVPHLVSQDKSLGVEGDNGQVTVVKSMELEQTFEMDYNSLKSRLLNVPGPQLVICKSKVFIRRESYC